MSPVEFGHLNAYRVFSCGRIESRFLPGSSKYSDRLGDWKPKKQSFKKSDYTGAGYLTVGIKVSPKCFKIFYVHRIVATHFLSRRPEQDQVDHMDGNRLNNDVSNLRWATQAENMQNLKERGVSRRTRFSGRLSRENVLDIISLINQGVQNKIIAQIFGVDRSNISKLKNKHRGIYTELHYLVNPPTAQTEHEFINEQEIAS